MLATEHSRIRAITLVTIRRSPSEIYTYCRDFSNLPSFMQQIRSVCILDSHRSHWIAFPAPFKRIEWDTEIVYDRRDERIAWHSISNTNVDSDGSFSLRAAPNGLGTDVLFEISYLSAGSVCAAGFAELLQRDPCRQVCDDLRLLKYVLESQVQLPAEVLLRPFIAARS